jgi:hypothetical protein
MRNKACVVAAAVMVTLGVIGCSTAAPKPKRPTTRASASPGATAIADCTSGLLGAAFEGGNQPGAGQALGFVFLWDTLASACALGSPVTITGLSRAGRQVTPAVRFTLPPFTSARLTPDGTKPDKQGRIPAREAAATMTLIATGIQPDAGSYCPGLIDPATWRITLASGGSLTTANVSAVTGPLLTSDGGLSICPGALNGQSPIQFEQG